MNKYRLTAALLAAAALLSIAGCTQNTGADSVNTENTEDSDRRQTDMSGQTITNAVLPEELETIPRDYYSESDQPGTLTEFEYDTYESMTYDQEDTVLHKRAIVYLPYGYSEDMEYNVFYLMHGGWSDETTYNNESNTDSSNYSLALQLTENYHNELVNDLIPAIEGTYSTYAKDTTPEGLSASRDHRAFCGFFMGSVATWRTFQYCLDYFRYFMPSSGSLTSDGEYMADIVRDSGHDWNDFFIFAASGTDDFAYSSFKAQIGAMADVEDGTFRYADNEREGNLYFLEQEGGVHSGEYAMEYFYNGLCWIW